MQNLDAISVADPYGIHWLRIRIQAFGEFGSGARSRFLMKKIEMFNIKKNVLLIKIALYTINIDRPLWGTFKIQEKPREHLALQKMIFCYFFSFLVGTILFAILDLDPKHWIPLCQSFRHIGSGSIFQDWQNGKKGWIHFMFRRASSRK